MICEFIIFYNFKNDKKVIKMKTRIFCGINSNKYLKYIVNRENEGKISTKHIFLIEFIL